MLTGKKAVIFDLDGTLIDSMWMWRQIDIDYLARFDIPLPDGLQKDIEGMSFSETAIYFKERFNIPDSLDKIKSDWNAMAMDLYKTKVTLKPGALDFLRYLKDKDIRMGIATSNSRELLNAALKSLKIEQYFDSVHISCDVNKGKPAPDIYLLVAGELGARPDECLVFEDISQGVMAGINAGMKVCGIYDEYAKMRNDNVSELADYYINTYDDMYTSTGDLNEEEKI